MIRDLIITSLTNVHALDEERKQLEALAEIDRAKTMFFSNISHEFRTPLTLFLGPIGDLLNDPEISENNRERAQVAFRNSHRMQKLVNLLLDFSRIEAGRMEANFTPVDLVSVTEDLISNFRAAIEKAGMKLIFKAEKIAQPVYLDIDMWKRLFLIFFRTHSNTPKKAPLRYRSLPTAITLKLLLRTQGLEFPKQKWRKFSNDFTGFKISEAEHRKGLVSDCNGKGADQN